MRSPLVSTWPRCGRRSPGRRRPHRAGRGPPARRNGELPRRSSWRGLGYAAMSGAWLVLPTYNEAENLVPIVDAATGSLATCAPESRLLIVDDNSPDGTGEMADRLARERDDVEVLHRRRKEGIGPAYLAGFGRAPVGGADLMLEMDADFSHHPADIPRLVEAAADADLVLG